MIDRRRAFQILRAARVHEPAIVKLFGSIYIFKAEHPIGSGKTIEQALDDGGFLPVPDGVVEPFTSEGNDVRKGGEHVAIAKTRNFALRIANALNYYVPNSSGY